MHTDDLSMIIRRALREELGQILPNLLLDSQKPLPAGQPLPVRNQLTAKEVVESYGISKRTLIYWQHDGLPVYRVGNKKFYKIEDINRFIGNKRNEY